MSMAEPVDYGYSTPHHPETPAHPEKPSIEDRVLQSNPILEVSGKMIVNVA